LTSAQRTKQDLYCPKFETESDEKNQILVKLCLQGFVFIASHDRRQ